MTDKGYYVVIEWDGLPPPTPFYHRMKRLTSRVRGDKSISPIARRSEKRRSAVVMQEGAIYCTDEQLARAIALLAERYGAKDVTISTVIENKSIVADEQDLIALSKIEELCGHRGRPDENMLCEDGWVVFCYNEMNRKHYLDTKKPINCPECGSFMMHAMKYGSVVSRRTDLGWLARSTVEESWIASKFYSGIFLSAPIAGNMMKSDNYGNVIPYEYRIFRPYDYYSAEERVRNDGQFKTITPSASVLIKMLGGDLSFTDAFHADIPAVIELLDAIYVGQMYVRPERRQQERIAAIVRILGDNHDITIDKLAEDPDNIDFFDAASRMDHGRLSELFSDVKAYYQDEDIEPMFYQRKVAVF